MANGVFRVNVRNEYRRAGPTDLIRLLPAPGGNPLFLAKWIVETLVSGVIHQEIIHLSGPTGTAKSSLLEALTMEPRNFKGICKGLGLPYKPLKLYPIEMATYEAPGEMYQRRALKDGTTFDEKSSLVQALEDAGKSSDKRYPLIWLREIGRVHSASVQGGLLNLMTKSGIILPDGSRIDGSRIAWVADSNYQVEQDSTNTLVTLDDALKRRFCINLTLDYLTAEQETEVVRQILAEEGNGDLQDEWILKAVQLGNLVRAHRTEGNLQSLAPPTIYGYLAFLRLACALPHLTLQQVALATTLGNASLDDRDHVAGVLGEVFGIQAAAEDDPTMGGNLF